MSYIEQAILWTIDTLFPKYCVGCLASDTFLCQECFAKIVFIKQQQCGRCLKLSTNGKTCPKCKQAWALDNLLVAAYYQDGPVKELVHAFKYGGNRELKSNLIQIILNNPTVTAGIGNITGDKIIIAVPLHFRRKWWRGFNQSELIANELSKQFNIPLLTNIIVRKTNTKIQASLHRKERMKNLVSAFKVNTCLPPNTSVILIDDIATTGATLNACALALKKAGAKHVLGAVIARAF